MSARKGRHTTPAGPHGGVPWRYTPNRRLAGGMGSMGGMFAAPPRNQPPPKPSRQCQNRSRQQPAHHKHSRTDTTKNPTPYQGSAGPARTQLSLVTFSFEKRK